MKKKFEMTGDEREDLQHFLHMLSISEVKFLNWKEVKKKAKMFKEKI